MDMLSQVIGLLHPRALLWKQLEARGAWSIKYPAHDGAVFCLVEQGQCMFQPDGGEPQMLLAGDLMLMTGPPVWWLADSLASKLDAPEETGHDPRARMVKLGGGLSGAATRILGGYFTFNRENTFLLKSVLPALAVMPSPHPDAMRMRRLLDMIGDEAQTERPGQTMVLERLLEILLVEAIRRPSVLGSEAPQPGMLAGLGDPKIGAALRALHAKPDRRWTVELLAAQAAMSRSAFAARFSSLVGTAPFDYLQRWRMALAKDALRRGEKSLAEIATACGYQSASAFSVAFARAEGLPPSRYAASKASDVQTSLTNIAN